MFRVLLEKELKSILLSPRFFATFSVCSVLLVVSVLVGVWEYRSAVQQYEAGSSLSEQALQEAASYAGMSARVYRKPNPMQLFVSGVHHDIGRFADIERDSGVKLTNSVYSEDTIFAVFRFIDLAFIVKVVLSLFAILFTYDAISGEREHGTLKLIFANALPRTQYILAKFTGAWLALTAPLAIPVLLSLLLVNLYGVPLTSAHWTELALLMGSSILYFTCFLAIGLLVSTCTRHAAVSFLVLLVAWVLIILIIPRAAVMAAGQLIKVPAAAEIAGRQDAYANDQWQQYEQTLARRWQARSAEMQGMSENERAAYRDANLWQWMEEDEAARSEVQDKIDAFQQRVQEDLRNRKAEMERLAFTLSRFSPASAYQLSAMNLASTNIDLKARYSAAMQSYRARFIDYAKKKQQESGDSGGIRVMVDSEAGMNISVGRDSGKLDISDMPRFQAPAARLPEVVAALVVDWGLLTLYALLAFAMAYVRFLRYDVR